LLNEYYKLSLLLPCTSGFICSKLKTISYEKRALIHFLSTFPATLSTPQSAAVIAGCDHAWQDERMRSLIHCLPTLEQQLQSMQVYGGG
jgi:hypothetical protein